MGKKAKEHRKKVAARNQRLKAEQAKMRKVYQEMFEKKMTELQNMNVELNGQDLGFEVVGETDVTQPQVEEQTSELEK